MVEGIVRHKGISYQVIYHKTDPTRIKRAGLTYEGRSHVKLSFRVAQPEFDIPNTVLVKLYKNTKGVMR